MVSPDPRWRVRRTPAPWWRRWAYQLLAQADVQAPDGARYQIRVAQRLTLRDSPLGPFDVLVPPPVSLALQLGANAYRLGRGRLVIQVARGGTAWRTPRVIHTERVRRRGEVGDQAVTLAEAVQRGAQPWEESAGRLGPAVRRVMGWD